jgi:cytochrome oxidase Cu insertion factor (SCO1/SenC/PrrC family)
MALDLSRARISRLAALLIASIAFGVARAGAGDEQKVDRSLQGWPIAEFRLVDQHGTAFGRERLLGRWTFMLVGTEGSAAALQALDGLTQRIRLTEAVLTTQVVLVAHDPAALKRALSPYDPYWVGASGPRRVLARLADDLGVEGGEPDGSLALVDPQGFVHVRYLAPFDVLRLTAHYLKSRALYR